MPRRMKPKYPKARVPRPRPPQNPFAHPGQVMKPVMDATVSMVGIGAVTTLGIGVLNTLKPSP